MIEETVFTELLPGVHRKPFFYRLAFLRQLSTVAMSKHLDATHSRLSHAMGVVKVAAKMLNRIAKDWGPTTELNMKACLFYSFLHDCFHGPMGHSLDMMKDVFDPTLTNKLDNGYFQTCVSRITSLGPHQQPTNVVARSVLDAAETCMPEEGRELVRRVALLSDPAALRKKAQEVPYFLRDIVDSVLDADRLDYLMRDGRALEGYWKEIPKLIENVRAVEDDGLLRLAFPEDLEGIVAEALRLRRRLYTGYYEHPDKLVVDDMICHGLYYVLRDKGILASSSNRIDEERRRDILESVMLLTDDDFFPALSELRARPHCYDLLTRVRQHNYYVKVFEESLQLDTLGSTGEALNAWMTDVGSWAKKLAQERDSEHYPQVARPEDRSELKRVSENYTAQMSLLVFAFQWKASGLFTERRLLERGLWQRLVAGDADSKLRQRYVAQQYGGVDYTDLDTLDEFPPIHVTTTSSFNIRSRQDMEYHSKEGGGSNAVLFYRLNDGGSPVAAGTRRLVGTEILPKHRAYPMVLSAPQALVDVWGGDTLRQFVVEELRSCDWLWELIRARSPLPAVP